MSEHDPRAAPSPASSEPAALLACARAALGGDAGAYLLRHLERRYLGHALAPSASEAELRHLEGQRSVVLYLHHLVATARRGPTGDPA
ncbi:MAG: hypothetical protein ACLFU0_01925 [Alphaproteobacteria bacterium]